jgi:hypothetical protein
VSRVLRGGAWNNNPRNCRAANRNNNDPDNRNNNIGFRLCCSSHIVILSARRSSAGLGCRWEYWPTTVCQPRPESDRWRR